MRPILDTESEPAREELFPRAAMAFRMDIALLSTFSAAPSTYFLCLQPSGLGHLSNRTFGGIAERHPCVEHLVCWGCCHA
jgi:hypothetical protein